VECDSSNEERAKAVHEEKISTMSDGADLQAPCRGSGRDGACDNLIRTFCRELRWWARSGRSDL
jgi:hypothetical protein